MTRLCEPRYDMTPCGQYVFGFEYVWDIDLPTVGFIFLHPSACDWRADPDLGRATGFAFERYYGGVMASYVYPNRMFPGQSLEGLIQVSDDHAYRLEGKGLALFDHCSHIVAAWGDHSVGAERIETVTDMLASGGFPDRLMCFGLTKSGAPKPITKAHATSRVKPWKL